MLELFALVLPVEERSRRPGSTTKISEQHQQLRQQRPGAEVAEVESAEVVEGHASTFIALAQPASRGASLAARGRSTWRRRFAAMARFMLNVQREFVDARALSGAGTALISTSSGCSSHGEASMLRISVETRAFDCA